MIGLQATTPTLVFEAVVRAERVGNGRIPTSLANDLRHPLQIPRSGGSFTDVTCARPPR
jgi:hypothetical protein